MMNLPLSSLFRLGITVVMLVAMPLQLGASNDYLIEQQELLIQSFQREQEIFEKEINKIASKVNLNEDAYFALFQGANDERICDDFQQLVEFIMQHGRAPKALIAVTNYRELEVSEALDAKLEKRTTANLITYRWNQYVEKHIELRDISFYLIDLSQPSGEI